MKSLSGPTRITLRQLEVFSAIAGGGSTTAAAESVARSQSATSAALAALERALGARLFDRVGKRLELNDAGRALLPAARALLDGAREIERGFGAGALAAPVDLRLAASTTIGNYLLPALIAEFRASSPAARFDVRIGNTRDAVDAIVAFEADLGLIEGPSHAPDVVAIPWIEDELVVVSAPTHALARAARRERVPLRALRAALWLMREPGSGTREAVEQALRPHLEHWDEEMTLGGSEAIKHAAAQGMGLGCLSRSVVADFVDAGRLSILATRLPRLRRRFFLIHHRRKLLSTAARAFLDHCRKARR